jgi:hypothetical protein
MAATVCPPVDLPARGDSIVLKLSSSVSHLPAEHGVWQPRGERVSDA